MTETLTVSRPLVRAPQKKESTRALALRGSAWTLIGYGGGQVLRLGSNLILARLLFPGAFGLMALVQIFMQGLQMFSDVGIGPSIIQSKRGEDPTFLNTAWTMQVARGACLWACAAAVSWPAAKFYGTPQLAMLIPVSGLTAVIAGFNSTSLFTLNRKLALGRVTAINLAAQVVSIIVMVGWACFDRSVWALVAGGLVNSLLVMVLSHVALPGIRNRFCWSWEARSELLHFGKWIFISTILTFVAQQLDRLMLGKLIGVDLLGVYSVALLVVQLPRVVVARLAAAVIYPVLAQQVQSNPAELGATVRKVRQGVLLTGLAASLFLCLGSPLMFRYLYDPRYAAAGWMGQLLSAYVWFSVLQASVDRTLLALGDSRATALSNLANVIVTAAGCLAGFALWRMPGFIIGLSLSSLAGHAVILMGLRRHGIKVIGQDIAYTAALVSVATFGLLGAKLIGGAVPGPRHDLAQGLFLSGVVLATCAYGGVQLRRKLSRRPSPAGSKERKLV